MKDQLERPTHERVSKIQNALKNVLNNWFDGERMQDDVVIQMTRGIDESARSLFLLQKLTLIKLTLATMQITVLKNLCMPIV